jgi:prepilin-type N-terminal cleavage/methylation domain-containing protein
MNKETGRTRSRGFTLIEVIIVVGVIIILAGAAVPSFGSTLARMRIQSNASQMAQDLQLVRASAITYQQDLYVYVCTSPAASRTTYYYELFQKNPLTTVPTHYTPMDAPVSGKFVKKVALYNMSFGVPFWSGPTNISPTLTTLDGRQYVVFAFCCGEGSNFRGQPGIVSSTLAPPYTAFSGVVGIPVVDSSSRTWYVAVSPTGQASSSGVSP